MKCALIGERLGHSYSKLIHEAFGLYSYELVSLPKDKVGEFMENEEFDAFNVTIPYKRTVMPYCSYISPEAQKIGSVNTVVRTSDGLHGFNTDYFGFKSMAERAGIDFAGKKVVILGSGGTSLTARAVASDGGAERITVVSRSGEYNYDNLEKLADCEVLINTTPVGMYPNNGCSAASLDKFPRCEAVLDVIELLTGSVTEQEANLLYIAVTTDTGCFQYANTNAATLRAAARLLELGADNRKVSMEFFRKISRARMALVGHIYSGMRFFRGGQIAIAVVTRALIDALQATEDDCDDIAGLPGRADGVVVSVTIRELTDGRSKISVRTTPEVDSCAICAVYGGGGHKMASGCTLACDPETAVEKILAAIDQVWPA